MWLYRLFQKKFDFDAVEALSSTSMCCRKKETLTLISIIAKRVENSHSDVDQTGQVEGDASPKRDMTGEPEQSLIFCTNRTGISWKNTQSQQTL